MLKPSSICVAILVAVSLVWAGSRDKAVLFVNEIMTASAFTNGAMDEDGDFQGWIELYNGGESAIDLTGYYLSNGDYIPKSQFDRSFGLELEGPKECLAGLLERRSRHINLFPQFFAIRLVGPLGKAYCGGFLYRVGGSLLTALHGRSVSLFCSQGHSPREPGTPCGHYSILPGEDTFLQVYGRLGIHEGVVPAEPARKNLITHLLDRFRDSVLGSKG